MLTLTLSGLMSGDTYRVLLCFARIGTAFLLLPGYGEPGVPTRVRVLAALGVAVTIAPAVHGLPRGAAPGPWPMVFAVAAEATTGALLGVLSRTVISGVLTAGQVISLNVGLNNVFAQGAGYEQSAALGTGVYAALTAALFAAGGHHLVLRALLGSYDVVAPGTWPDAGASVQAVVLAGTHSLRLACQLALPFLLLALLFNASLALVNRAMPALPVFHLGAPALVGLGLYLLAAAAPGLIDQALAAAADVLGAVR